MIDDSYIINVEICDTNNNIIIENKDSIMSIEFINNDAIIVEGAVIDLENLEL